MKTKLLREIRKDVDYKFDKTYGCVMYFKGKTLIVTKKSVEEILIKYLNIKSRDEELTWLDWNWYSIFSRYKEKCVKRQFRKM